MFKLKYNCEKKNTNKLKREKFWFPSHKSKKMSYLKKKIYVFNNSFARAGSDTTSIFKRNLVDLNTVFFLLDWLPNQK